MMLDSAMSEAERLYRSFYDNHAGLAFAVGELGIPLPKRFPMAVDFTLNTELLNQLSAVEPDACRIRGLLEEVKRTGIAVDAVTLEFAFRRTVERLADRLSKRPDPSLMEAVTRLIQLSPSFPFGVNLWWPQNVYFELMRSEYPNIFKRAARRSGEPDVGRPIPRIGQGVASSCRRTYAAVKARL